MNPTALELTNDRIDLLLVMLEIDHKRIKKIEVKIGLIIEVLDRIKDCVK